MRSFTIKFRTAGLLFLCALLIVGCGDGDNDDPSDNGAATATSSGSAALSGNLTVFAAASLTDAFEEVAAALRAAHPDLDIAYNFAGSQQLVTQLNDGARADLFASANLSQMSDAQDAGVIAGKPVVFIVNRLAIIVPDDDPAGIGEPRDLATDGIKLVVANPAVPVGRYSLEVLDKMSADPEFGADFRSMVESNIVSQEDNVKQVVTKVQLGEADAGIVYVSDVTSDVAGDVEFIEIPDQFNVLAEYPIAAVSDGNSELAQAFIDFILSADGQAILERHGFTTL